MHHAEGAGGFGIKQFIIELADLGGEQQSLVNDGARGKRRDGEHFPLAQVGVAHGGFDPLANDKQFSFESVRRQVIGTAHKKLFNIGLGSAGDPSQNIVIDRNIAPAENG